MKMFEKLKMGVGYSYVTDAQLAYAQKVYDRYVGCLKERYGDNYGTAQGDTAVSLAEFLLEDVGYRGLDSFVWERGVLVRRVTNGTDELGMTTGWTLCGFGHPVWRVTVAFATGERTVAADQIVKADIPLEVLEYVKSALQTKVHDKVDEAFKGGGGGS